MIDLPVDTYSYKGWLNSDSFWKRAFGIFGYYLAATLAIYIVLMILLVILAVFATFVFSISGY